VFYELFRARAALKRNDIAFLRIEQIAPFPFDRVAKVARSISCVGSIKLRELY
jgi:2-oxoglutarate dehydrogenase complex dehydrogenase (E1) component-like enzyme